MKLLRPQAVIPLSFWTAAALTGVISVLYAQLIAKLQSEYFAIFALHPYLATAAMPVLFVGATALVVKLAPQAGGSGIPQVLSAIHDGGSPDSSLVSIRTGLVKMVSTSLGVIAGASIGREGPTVQVAASLFAWFGRLVRRAGIEVETRSYLVAGAAAGVAAAFNTPLAGVTFALEEIAESSFAQFKQWVMIAVIIAGITAQVVLGNYLYFGHPVLLKPNLASLGAAVVIGLLGGACGGGFARLLVALPRRLPGRWWLRSLVCGIVCAAVGLLYRGETAGSGYEVTRAFMDGAQDKMPYTFMLGKLVVTVMSYASGMAGGIFAPCLSMGASLGFTVATILKVHTLRTSALVGMSAFFTGATQAPLTAVIIVMEMTDEHAVVLPLLLGAVLAQLVAKKIMEVPLYHQLAERFMAKEHLPAGVPPSVVPRSVVPPSVVPPSVVPPSVKID